jgi:hypothetical protein
MRKVLFDDWDQFKNSGAGRMLNIEMGRWGMLELGGVQQGLLR